MNKHNPQDATALEAARDKGHETRDVAPRSVALAGIGLAGLVVVSMLAMWGLWSWLADPDAGPSDSVGGSGREMLSIRLELQAEQRETIARYGWIDRQQQVARIPIERAMELIAAEPTLLAGVAEQQPAGVSSVPPPDDAELGGSNDQPNQDAEPQGGGDE